jgi:hypothetical protein
MKTHSPQNERIKRAYFSYLAEAKGFSEPTLDAVAKALNRFETYTISGRLDRQRRSRAGCDDWRADPAK